MKKICLSCLFVLITQSLFSQIWANRYFDSIGVRDYYSIFAVSRNLFKAKNDSDKHGYIDRQGKIVIPFEYDWLGFLSEGLIQAVKNERCGYIDTSGNVVIPYMYKMAYPFQEGLAAVQKDEKFGFINKGNEFIILPVFDHADKFAEGLASVGINGKSGYINHKGETVIPANYDIAYGFEKGSAIVGFYHEKGWKLGLIDKSGNLLSPIEYDNIDEIIGDKYIVEKGGKWGIINAKGEEVAPCIYTSLHNGLFYRAIKLNDKMIVIDDEGNLSDSHRDFEDIEDEE